MGEVITFERVNTPVADNPNQTIIDALESTLARARNGEFKTLAIVAITADEGKSFFLVPAGSGRITLVGALAVAQSDLIEALE